MEQLNIVSIVDWMNALAPDTVLRLVSDSRSVRTGDLFFAYPVGNGDGRRYIKQAIAQGAIAVIYEQNDFAWDASLTLPHLPVPELLWHSGFIAAGYLKHPDSTMFNVAVTGTNGKTSCTQWLARAMSMMGQSSCVIGTLGVAEYKKGIVGEFGVTGFTTPDALQLQQVIETERQSGVESIAIEASSIGLEQGRLNGMHVDVAVFTNLTRDHLDFHGDMSHYEAAKQKLVEWPDLKAAVLNLDDGAGVRLTNICSTRGVPIIGYMIEESGTDQPMMTQPLSLLKASNLRNYHGGTSFHLDSPFGSGTVKTQMIGRFNVSNILAVLGTLFVKGVSWADAVRVVEQLTSVAGRMEQLSSPGRVLVIIDYAHTPDALEKTLTNLREVSNERHGKLWCVFGCGGDRDPGKRSVMGKIAELADEIIVTSDNPRSEEPDQIMAQIAAGFTPDRTPVPILEADRAKAILLAIKHAGKNDVVLVAGKGHEAYQEIKGKKLPFSDIDHANIALASLASKGTGL